jgi:hypothetical protein
MRSSLLSLETVVILTSVVAIAQESAPQVAASLSLAGAQTTFKAGEPVTVVMSFSGVAGRYHLSSIVYPGTPGPDKILFTPTDGITKVYAESYAPDYMNFTPLGNQPVNMRITLNDWFRFDKPGHYTVEIESSRLFLDLPNHQDPKRTAPVRTNAVAFDIVPMTEDEESQEIARIKSEARTLRRPSQDPLRDLAYLTGDAAARDQVADALRTGRSGDLLRFRDRQLVLRLLDEGYLKPDTFVSQATLKAMVALHSLKDKQEGSRILVDYLRGLSRGLAEKSDRPRMVAAETILWLLQTNQLLESQSEIAQPAFAEVRGRLEASQFESMLRVFWPQLRDPSLVSALERILNSPRIQGRGHGAERRAAIDALFDLAPERARSFVIAELQNPEGLRDAGLLGRIPDTDLPELDAMLLSGVRALAAPGGPNRERSRFVEQTTILARFASGAILADVLDLYQKSSANWDPSIRAHFLAYFVRREGDEALPMVAAEAEDALRKQGTDLFVLSETANCYFSDSLARLLRERLNREESKVAATSAYLLSKYGKRDDKQLVAARLSRVAENDVWLKRDLTESLDLLRLRFPE